MLAGTTLPAMAGIYVHVPFCRQACHYCNFHFSTQLENTNAVVAAIVREAELRRDFFAGADRSAGQAGNPGADHGAGNIAKSTPPTPINSVYLGGGTPSVLTPLQWDQLFEALYRLFPIASDAEVTLEANPDDLDLARLSALRNTPVNRLSIGIQSFRDQDLAWMNRAHNAAQACDCLALAAEAGFAHVNADLIYGSPGLDDAAWLANMQQLFNANPDHISAYALTVEAGTALAHFVRQGKSPAPDDGQASRQFQLMEEAMAAAGYLHYEISNFCRPGAFARHNTAYWTGEPYLGLGPAAHSFIGNHRSWNVSHNIKYVTAVEAGQLPSEIETLSPADQLNEALMTGLRTTWGVDLERLEARFGARALRALTELAQPWLDSGQLAQQQGHWFLTARGRFFADRIASDLFLVEEDAGVVAMATASDEMQVSGAQQTRFWELSEQA